MLSPNQNWVRNIYYWPLDPDLEIINFLFRWRARYTFLGQWTFQKEANDGYPWTYTRTSCISTRLLGAILANYWTMIYNSVPPPGWVWLAAPWHWVQGWPHSWVWPLAAPTTSIYLPASWQPTTHKSLPEQVEDPEDLDMFLSQPFDNYESTTH